MSKDKNVQMVENSKRGLKKKDTTSPKMEFELVIITSAIDVHKSRYVDVVDMPGELLTTDMDKNFIMILQRRHAKLMVKTKPIIYKKFVTIENIRTVLYVKLQKALYGCL